MAKPLHTLAPEISATGATARWAARTLTKPKDMARLSAATHAIRGDATTVPPNTLTRGAAVRLLCEDYSEALIARCRGLAFSRADETRQAVKRAESIVDALSELGFAGRAIHVGDMEYLRRCVAFARPLGAIQSVEVLIQRIDQIWWRIQDPWLEGGLSLAFPPEHVAPTLDAYTPLDSDGATRITRAADHNQWGVCLEHSLRARLFASALCAIRPECKLCAWRVDNYVPARDHPWVQSGAIMSHIFVGLQRGLLRWAFDSVGFSHEYAGTYTRCDATLGTLIGFLQSRYVRERATIDPNRATAELQLLREVAPDNPNVLLHLGWVASTAGQLGESIRYYEHAATLLTRVPLIHLDLAYKYLISGDFIKAAASAETALRLQAPYLDEQSEGVLALALTFQQRYSEALQRVQHVLQAGGEHPSWAVLRDHLANGDRPRLVPRHEGGASVEWEVREAG